MTDARNGKRNNILVGVLAALVTLGGGTVVAFTFWDRVTADLRKCDSQLEETARSHDERLRTVEEQLIRNDGRMTRIDERTARMEEDIKEIKEAVK